MLLFGNGFIEKSELFLSLLKNHLITLRVKSEAKTTSFYNKGRIDQVLPFYLFQPSTGIDEEMHLQVFDVSDHLKVLLQKMVTDLG